jgi:hypothetical protein
MCGTGVHTFSKNLDATSKFCAIKVARSRNHTDDPKILGATLQNSGNLGTGLSAALE